MKTRLLIGIETLLSGGAELFVLRLANALRNRYTITVFVLHGDLIDKRLLDRQSVPLTILPFLPRLKSGITKIDRILTFLNIDFSFFEWLAVRYLNRIIQQQHFQILHSNQFKVDYVFGKANRALNFPHITTIHGDYINFYERLKRRNLGIVKFEEKAKTILTQLSGIAYIADYQVIFLSNHFGVKMEKCRKIYNGIELPQSPVTRSPNSKFTFGMVARGIPEKGWEEAIRAFLKMDYPNTQLILVGEGPHLNDLKARYPDGRIVFAGYSTTPMEWIEKFDVGLLPSTFGSESLPTTVIEYLACGKPVIATDVGEIKNMLIQNNQTAGIVVPVVENRVNALALGEAMKLLASDQEQYQVLKKNTIHHASLFDIRKCAEEYSTFYSLHL